MTAIHALPRAAAVLAAAALAACTPPAGSGPAPAAGGDLPRRLAPRPTEARITPADLMTRLYILADDSMMGRQAGHHGNVMGTSYVAAELRAMGLEPAGEGGSFFQNVPLVLRGLQPGAALSVDGQALALWTEWAPMSYRQGTWPFSPSLRAERVPVVFGGRLGQAMISDADARGKVVVLLPPLQENGQPNPRFWAGWPAGRFAGAAAVAVVALDVVAPNVLGVLRSESAGLAGGAAPPAGMPAAVLVSPAAAERLLGTSAAGAQVGAPGRTLTASYGFGERPTEAPARNVIAVLRGRDPALRNEYVAISAHNDHEGFARAAADHDSAIAYNTVMRPQGANDPVGRPSPGQSARIAAMRDSLRALRAPRRDSIFNGADDDGSGTVTLLEIAQELASRPERPRRSVLFISHTAEEAGLLGSSWFTDHPTVPRESIVALLNMDMVGHGRASEVANGGPYSIQMIGSRRLSSELGAAIEAVNARRERPMDIDHSWDAAGHPANRYCRSDHFMYARYGIPITYFSLGYHPHYHMLTDEPQYIDYEHMGQVGAFLRDIALELANRDRRPTVDGPRQDPSAPCRQ